VAGLLLAVAVDLRLLVIGVFCLAGAWFYSGGRRPYGYSGYGEIAVLLFFGFVATAGSAYVQRHALSDSVWWGALAVGLPACAVLVANNLRDIPTDAASGKRTLAVRLGATVTKRLYVGLLAGAFLAVVPIGLEHPAAFLGFAAVPLAVAPARSVLGASDPASLVRGLVGTVRVAVALSVLLTLGLVLR